LPFFSLILGLKIKIRLSNDSLVFKIGFRVEKSLLLILLK
jgi:hypothetical protein